MPFMADTALEIDIMRFMRVVLVMCFFRFSDKGIVITMASDALFLGIPCLERIGVSFMAVETVNSIFLMNAVEVGGAHPGRKYGSEVPLMESFFFFFWGYMAGKTIIDHLRVF